MPVLALVHPCRHLCLLVPKVDRAGGDKAFVVVPRNGVVRPVFVFSYHEVEPARCVPCVHDKLDGLGKFAVGHHAPDSAKGAKERKDACQQVYLVVDKVLRDQRYSKPAGRKEAGEGKGDKEVPCNVVITHAKKK